MGFFDRLSEGLSRSRSKFKEQMNVLLDRGPAVDDGRYLRGFGAHG